MADPLDWECRCGTVRAKIASGAGTRLSCYCKHCRAYAHLLKADAFLDDAGGTAIYQTTPDLISFEAGMDQLRSLKLTSKGPLRWYTACCDTPLANTLETPGLPFSGILLGGVKNPDAAGPESTRVHTDAATGPLTGSSGGFLGASVSILIRALKARLRGAHRKNPFFDDGGKPVSLPRTVSPEERAAAYEA